MKLVLISAGTPEALERRTDRIADSLQSGCDLAELSCRMRHEPALEYRRALVGADPAKVAANLRRRDPRYVITARARADRPVVFLAAGVGDQYQGMTAGLRRRLPAFAAHLDQSLRELNRELGMDLSGFLRSPEPDDTETQLSDTLVAQPVMFAVQYAMAATLGSLGVRPTALLGYSLGEYVAACVAGMLAPADAAKLVAGRARLVSELPAGGGMLAVMAGPEAVAPHLSAQVALAALDGPELTVLSGPSAELDRVARQLGEQRIACQPMATSHAFHSPLMAPATAPLRELVAGLGLRPPAIPVLSNGTGTWMAEEATSPDYWAGQLGGTVRFTENLAELWRLKEPVLVELGPGQGLIRLAMSSPDRPAEHGSVPVPTLPGPLERRPDGVVFLTAVARLWAAGTGVDLAGPTSTT